MSATEIYFKPLAIFCGCTAWLVSLVGNPEDSFSRDAAHLLVFHYMHWPDRYIGF